MRGRSGGQRGVSYMFKWGDAGLCRARRKSSRNSHDCSTRCSHLQSARPQCLWSNRPPRSLRCWAIGTPSAHRTHILGEQQEWSRQGRYCCLSTNCLTRPSRRDEGRYLAVARTLAGGCKLCGSSVGRPLGQLTSSVGWTTTMIWFCHRKKKRLIWTFCPSI